MRRASGRCLGGDIIGWFRVRCRGEDHGGGKTRLRVGSKCVNRWRRARWSRQSVKFRRTFRVAVIDHIVRGVHLEIPILVVSDGYSTRLQLTSKTSDCHVCGMAVGSAASCVWVRCPSCSSTASWVPYAFSSSTAASSSNFSSAAKMS